MRFALGCLGSALAASLFTVWLTQPQPARNRAVAQVRGSAFPERPDGPSQSTPPEWEGSSERMFKPDGPSPAAEDSSPRMRTNPPAPQAIPSDSAPILTPPSDNGSPEAAPTPANLPTPAEMPSREIPSRPDSSENVPTLSLPEPSGALNLAPDEATGVRVYETCNRGVVNITSKGLPGERFLFMEVPAEGSGSGSMIDRQGHILTNYHVVEQARHVEVGLYDGSTYDATFVGADPIYDLAIIKIDAPPEKLFPIPIGDSSRLKVGMRVFAIGNPFGLERTMTEGIVSSLNRTLEIRSNRSIKAIIQTDAAINPGNSGGPLLDSRGQLVGVNTAIATSAGQSAGVALAIPATLVERVVPQLIQHGRVIRPEIGIQQVLETEQGLRIAKLTPGGPAERAGLRGPDVTRVGRGPLVFQSVDRLAADLILQVDGKPVKTADDFLGLVERHRPGETVVLTIRRGEQTMDVSITLGGGPGQMVAPQPQPQPQLSQPQPQPIVGPGQRPPRPRPRPFLEPVPQR